VAPSQGDFFLRWYSAALLAHGRRVLEAAARVFFPFLGDAVQTRLREYGAVCTDDLASHPPRAEAASDLASDAGGAHPAALRGADSAASLVRAASPIATHVSSVHSQRSLPRGLCDLAGSGGEAPSPRPADAPEEGAWEERRDAGAAAGVSGPPTWKAPRGGEMPALPEAEPLRHAAAAPPLSRRLPRGGGRSDPSLTGDEPGGWRSGASVSPGGESAVPVGTFNCRRSLDISDDGGGASGDAPGLSAPTSRSSSFMSAASAADLRRDALGCLLLSVKLAGA